MAAQGGPSPLAAPLARSYRRTDYGRANFYRGDPGEGGAELSLPKIFRLMGLYMIK